jgi:hypothetical protein
MDQEGCRRLLRASGFTDVEAGRITPSLLGYATGRSPSGGEHLPLW